MVLVLFVEVFLVVEESDCSRSWGGFEVVVVDLEMENSKFSKCGVVH